MGTKPIVATPENVGLMLDRFNKFGRRISKGSKKFTLKQIWGKPRKREDWLGSPVNYKDLQGSFTARIHPLMKVKGYDGLIMGLNFTFPGSAVRISGRTITYDELNNQFFTLIYTGDKIFFYSDKIVVISKYLDVCNNKELSQLITFF